MAIKEKRHEALVGAFLLIGLVVLAALVIKFGRVGENSIDGKYNVELVFKDASGLIKGSEVRMGGARIGKVTNTPELTEDLTVKLELRLDSRIKIDENSIFQIQSLSIIGDKMIVVIPPLPEDRSGKFISDGQLIVGGGPGGLDAIQSDAESVAKDARVLMKDARTTLLKVDSSIDDVRAVVGQLADTMDKVNYQLLDEENLASVKASLANLKAATESFKTIGDEVKPTFKEAREAIASIKAAADSANKTIAEAGAQLKHIEPALAGVPEVVSGLKTVVTKAGKTMDTAEQAIAKVTKGDGLLKTLTSDKEFSNDTKQFMKNLKHYGIMRYKDDETYNEKDPKENRYRSNRRR